MYIVDVEHMKLLGECKIATCAMGLVRLQYLEWLPSTVRLAASKDWEMSG
jgi:hypothetical protein